MSYKKGTLRSLSSALVLACAVLPTGAQTNYRFGISSGTGGASGSGYTVADQSVTFIDAASSSFGTTNVMVSLSNQQYGNATAHPFEGITLAGYSGAVAFGTAGSTVSNTVPGGYPRFATLAYYGSPAGSCFTISKAAAAGTGVAPDATGALTMGVLTDALINSTGANINGVTDLGTDIQFADVTLTFNEPVSNPVIHLGGLGGTTDVVLPGGRKSWLGYAPVFQLLNGYSITRLSGSACFDVDTVTRKIKDSATWLGAQTTPSAASCYGGVLTYGASGSLLINGINITTLTFRLYLRSDAGRITNNLATIPCDGSVVNYPFTDTLYPRWSSTTVTRGDGFTLSVSFTRVRITGNVFNDPDGGNVNNSTGTANSIPSGLYANLIDPVTGLVLKSVPVGTDGVYDFGEQNANSYQVVLSSSAGTAGSAPPSLTLPSGWVNTGAFNGTPNTGNTGNTAGISEAFVITEAASNTGINFGIQQLPETDAHTTTIPQPNPNDTLVLDGAGSHPPLLSGSDAQDGTYNGATGTVRDPGGVIITSLPANGVLYYNGNPVASGDTIADPGLLTIVLTGQGYTEVSFGYAYLDAAGFSDPTPAVYNVNRGSPLPVTLISFTATKAGNTTVLAWTTAAEQYNRGFAIERRAEGDTWGNIGFANTKAADGNSSTALGYTFTDPAPLAGNNYYRLKQTNLDGRYAYSPVQVVRFDSAGNIRLFPNPANSKLTITGMAGNEFIYVYDAAGKLVKEQKAGNTDINISLEDLNVGVYHVLITDAEGSSTTHKIVKSK